MISWTFTGNSNRTLAMSDGTIAYFQSTSSSKPFEPLSLEQKMRTYEAKIRLAGRVSYVQVSGRDSAHARALVRAQYGDNVTVLEIKRVSF